MKCRYLEELEAEFDRLQLSEPDHLILEDDTTSIPLHLSEEIADKILSLVHTNGIQVLSRTTHGLLVTYLIV